MQSWTPNTPLQNGQYIIKRAIGGGGFGETYLAEDTEENRLVVIKTLNREQREKPDFAEIQKKFRKEALDLSKCYHPHIVQVYDNFPEDGLWAIVMEHIDGDDLAAYVENYTTENGYLSQTEALRYIDQIGQALECVHERKLLHRDVKPNNILLRRESKEAVLIDFGLAREFQPGKIKSMTAMITFGYAPIEQYERRGDFGYYTDVYALAATLYSLLTNRVPIPANYRAEEDVKLSPPQKFNQNISDKVNAAILKGMELEPVNRPQTVREFRELLGLVVKPVVNIPTPPPVNHQEERRTPLAEFSVGSEYGAALLELGEAAGFEDVESFCYGLAEATGYAPNDIYGVLTGDIYPSDEFSIDIANAIDPGNEELEASLFVAGVETRGEDINDYLDEDEDDDDEADYQPVNHQEERRTPSPNPIPASEEGGLKSSCGMDYRKLRDLLKAGKWKEADKETERVMLAVAKRENKVYLDTKSINNFPCEDLRTIDQLWVKYSDGKFGFSVQKQIYQGLGDGKFGFSVQKRIYQALGRTREYNSGIWDKFGEEVGWKKKKLCGWLSYNDITFDKKAPKGHLPVCLGRICEGWGFRGDGGFFSRVETCKL
ncbi:MAG: serine/threonine-protein kinase [Aphanizomenon gracile PMC627.10]|nr:serine/threonine-protein kinase [Aphanizomenon gracile PMC627.10]